MLGILGDIIQFLIWPIIVMVVLWKIFVSKPKPREVGQEHADYGYEAQRVTSRSGSEDKYAVVLITGALGWPVIEQCLELHFETESEATRFWREMIRKYPDKARRIIVVRYGLHDNNPLKGARIIQEHIVKSYTNPRQAFS